MTTLTTQEVREFCDVIKALLAASRQLFQEDQENVDCPCFSMLPSERFLHNIEGTLSGLQDNDYHLALIFRQLRCIFFQIRHCVRTHTLQLLDDDQFLRAE